MLTPYLTARFLTSCASSSQFPSPEGLEVAFAGRSNSGKSSTLNRICNQRGLAHVSKTPGRTQMINFFSLESGSRLVDLPGYGFARVPGKEQRRWRHLIEHYLTHRQVLRGVVIVMDARRPLTAYDIQMLDWCRMQALPAHAVLNKADKLKQGALIKTLREVEASLSETWPNVTAQTFSATRGKGTEKLYKTLGNWLSEAERS